jgi:hypothetical protein
MRAGRAFLTLLGGAAATLPFGACSGLNSSPRKALVPRSRWAAARSG